MTEQYSRRCIEIRPSEPRPKCTLCKKVVPYLSAVDITTRRGRKLTVQYGSQCWQQVWEKYGPDKFTVDGNRWRY